MIKEMRKRQLNINGIEFLHNYSSEESSILKRLKFQAQNPTTTVQSKNKYLTILTNYLILKSYISIT